MRHNPEYITQHSWDAAGLGVSPTARRTARVRWHRARRGTLSPGLMPFFFVALMVLSAGLSPVSAQPGPFPVTIEHKFGTTIIPREPSRVVTIGFSEQDPVLGLGVKPVAVRDWFGDQPYAVWPWSREALGDARPQVLRMPFGELDYEALAVLRPNLIIATHSGIQEHEYQRLARIAPTIAQPGTYPDFGVPWQEQTRIIGRALGREAEAEALIARVEVQIAAARASHPEFEGATVAWVSPAGQGLLWAVGPSTPPMRFLADLGLRLPDALARHIGNRDSAQVSQEQARLLETDVLIFHVLSEAEREQIERHPVYRQLKPFREGRVVFFVGPDDPVYGALSFSTVMSLPYALEHLVPRMAAALDGDPATPTR